MTPLVTTTACSAAGVSSPTNLAASFSPQRGPTAVAKQEARSERQDDLTAPGCTSHLTRRSADTTPAQTLAGGACGGPAVVVRLCTTCFFTGVWRCSLTCLSLAPLALRRRLGIIFGVRAGERLHPWGDEHRIRSANQSLLIALTLLEVAAIPGSHHVLDLGRLDRDCVSG